MGVAHERDGQAACRQGQQRAGGARCQKPSGTHHEAPGEGPQRDAAKASSAPAGPVAKSPPAPTTKPPARDPSAMPALNAMGCSDAENVRALG